MDKYKFDLERAERELTLMNYERVKPIAETLLDQGYSPVKTAVLLFQYGFYYGRKLLRDAQKESRLRKLEEMSHTEEENESQTSGENEGSV